MKRCVRLLLLGVGMILLSGGVSSSFAEEKAAIENRCGEYGLFDYFLPKDKPLKEWYHYLVDQFHCQPVASYFLTLLSEDPLLEEKITSVNEREEFYQSLRWLLKLNWKKIQLNEDEEAIMKQNLDLINKTLEKVISNIPTNQIDLFRERVLIGIQSEFVYGILTSKLDTQS